MNFIKIIFHSLWCSWHPFRENLKNGKDLGCGDWMLKIKCSRCGREKYIFKKEKVK